MKVRTNPKTDFEKDFFKLINDSVFRNIMETVRRYIDIKLITTEIRAISLVSELSYHIIK